MATDPLLLKTIFIVLIFMFGICGVLTPRLFDPFGTKISYANLIACGVIISAALVHLLSDASQSLFHAPLPLSHGGNPYPWAYLICGLSFILLFFFERLLIHQLLHHHHHHGHHHKHVMNHPLGHHHKHIMINTPLDDHNHEEDHIKRNESSSLIDHHHDHHHGVVKEHANDMFILLNQKNYFSAIVLLFGLGIHSVLAGLALGASSLNTQTIALGIAILSHKYLASFALGCPLFKSLKSFRITVLIAIFFALLTPVGVIVGILLTNTFEQNEWISDIFICIASGTFLYVAICEIMIPEFSENKQIEKKIYQAVAINSKVNSNKKECVEESCDAEHCKPKQHDDDDLRKMLCVLCGFGVMSLLAFWI